jgi:hypothetical protein
MTAQALELLCPSLADLAGELGVSHDTMKSYSLKRRAPGPDTARALVNLMRKRAKTLARLADRLEQAVAEGGD